MTYRDLAFAVVFQAVRQAARPCSGQKEAREWLASDESLYLTEPLEIDQVIADWVAGGCKLSSRMLRCDKKSNRDWHAYYKNKREK